MQVSHKNITRLKNITNSETGKAYLNLENKEFILHYPDKLKKGILESKSDELIVLYQRTSKNKPRFLTHLVRPIDSELIEENQRENFKFGRLVEVIAYTGEEDKIPFEDSLLSKLDFRNRAWGNAELMTNLINENELNNYQQNLWELFEPFISHKLKENEKDYQMYFNDEFNRDFETKEGKLLFRNHRIRERDGSISHKKKQMALIEEKYECEICNFSFIEFYGEEYIECHHIVPINKGERITKLEDLALVCSNCHRMLHRKINGNYLSVEKLKNRLNLKKQNAASAKQTLVQ